MTSSDLWLDALVRDHRSFVLARALRLTRHRDDAEDLTQDVFVRAGAARDGFDGRNAEAWLTTITTNLARDRARSVQRRPTGPLVAEPVDRAATPDEHVVAGEFDPRVSGALEGLPAALRLPVQLCDIEGYTQAEVAGMLGVRIETLRTRLHRARKRLAADLADLWAASARVETV